MRQQNSTWEVKFSIVKEISFGLTVVSSQQAVKGWASLSQNLETMETNSIKSQESRGRGVGDSWQTSLTCAEQVPKLSVYGRTGVSIYRGSKAQWMALIQVLEGICLKCKRANGDKYSACVLAYLPRFARCWVGEQTAAGYTTPAVPSSWGRSSSFKFPSRWRFKQTQ